MGIQFDMESIVAGVSKETTKAKETLAILDDQTNKPKPKKEKQATKTIVNKDLNTREVQLNINSIQKPGTKPVTITLDKDVLDAIDKKAAKIITNTNQGNRSKLINIILRGAFLIDED
jgi:hypothetical protein